VEAEDIRSFSLYLTTFYQKHNVHSVKLCDDRTLKFNAKEPGYNLTRLTSLREVIASKLLSGPWLYRGPFYSSISSSRHVLVQCLK